LGLVAANLIRASSHNPAASKAGDMTAPCATLSTITQQPLANRAPSRHDSAHNRIKGLSHGQLAAYFVRNGFGEVIRETSPDAGVTTYVGDLRGLVTQVTDGGGIVLN
jgi:hypothetical protein